MKTNHLHPHAAYRAGMFAEETMDQATEDQRGDRWSTHADNAVLAEVRDAFHVAALAMCEDLEHARKVAS